MYFPDIYTATSLFAVSFSLFSLSLSFIVMDKGRKPCYDVHGRRGAAGYVKDVLGFLVSLVKGVWFILSLVFLAVIAAARRFLCRRCGYERERKREGESKKKRERERERESESERVCLCVSHSYSLLPFPICPHCHLNSSLSPSFLLSFRSRRQAGEKKKKVAVIGGGIAGCSAAWALARSLSLSFPLSLPLLFAMLQFLPPPFLLLLTSSFLLGLCGQEWVGGDTV